MHLRPGGSVLEFVKMQILDDQVMEEHQGEPVASIRAKGTFKHGEAERQQAKRQKLKATGPHQSRSHGDHHGSKRNRAHRGH